MADNVEIRDAQFDIQTMRTTDTGGVHVPHHNVDSITPGTAATALGKAEDAAHTDGDVGVMALAVRRDADTTLAGTTGDYAPLQVNAAGALKVTSPSTPADSAAFTPATTPYFPVGGHVDNVLSDALTEGEGGVVRLTTARSMHVALKPDTTGGVDMFKRVSTADDNDANIKAGPGVVFGWSLSNVNAAVRYLKLFNLSTAPTVGSDVPVLTIAIPGSTAGGVREQTFPVGLFFDTGIAMCLTTEATDAGTTGVAASEIVVNIFYK